jgi:polyhydroxyalkanoate synthesis repressor PhaR
MLHRDMATVVKKYSNRRLYDTDESRYITLEELTDKIRSGTDVRVVDAKSGDDLTQATLTQVILEGPAARLLPVPLLTQLIRMQNDALGEFFGKYMTAALEMYLAAKSGAQAVQPYFPLATLPFTATNAFARLFTGQPSWQPPPPAPPPEPEPEPAKSARTQSDDVAELRKELDELKKSLKRRRR